MSFHLPLLLLVAAALAVFLDQRVRTYLLFFQQEEYDGLRFRRWLARTGARDRVASLAAVIAAPVAFMGEGREIAALLADVVLLAGLAEGMRRSRAVLAGAKKPLAMTGRARRIHLLALLLGLALAALLWGATGLADPLAPAVATLVAAQAVPWLPLAANRLLGPVERRIRVRYRREAEDKLRRLDPYVIGITGSFGKTSTKHILAHVLSSAAPTLATPGSVNTEMGITRVVREALEERHRYFIVEMGAYGPGSIARLCRLAPPRLGLITAVGPAHYERFGDIATVFDAKFELADAVAGAGGVTVVNADAVPADMLAARLADRPRGIRAVGGDCTELRLEGVRQTRDGLEIGIAGEDLGHTTLRVPIYGKHQAANILLVVAAARELGMPIEAIRAALAGVPQIRHRLEVHEQGGIAVIDDAYNSNPDGFAAALELLDLLVAPGRRRILVTPGMVELGTRHAEEHARLGALAARHADIALLVTPGRIPEFVAAFREERGSDEGLHEFARQKEAEAWVRANLCTGDAVLYENNLPDLYEARPRF